MGLIPGIFSFMILNAHTPKKSFFTFPLLPALKKEIHFPNRNKQAGFLP
jgi:hypothetical protein